LILGWLNLAIRDILIKINIFKGSGMMDKIYTATVKNSITLSANDDDESIVLFPGDMISVVDNGGNYYYILEYNTIDNTAKNNLKNTKRYVVGRYIAKDIAATNLNISDTGLETDFSNLRSNGEATRSMDGPNGSATESLYASYSVTPRTEGGKMLSSPKVALDVRRNSYDYTIDSITKKNNNSYIVNGIEYITGLESNYEAIAEAESLPIKSLIGILGIPHQFSAITDPRITAENRLDDQQLGRVYANNIIKTIPLLLITPGVPHFTAKNSNGTTANINNFFGEFTRAMGSVTHTGNTGVGDYRGKYYSIEFQYAEYYNYVNAMLRAAAKFMGLENEVFHGVELGEMQWNRYNSGLFTTSRSTTQAVLNWLSNQLQNLLGSVGLNNIGSTQISDCVAFYANCGENVTDSFDTSVTASSYATSINSLSDTAREYQFLAGGLLNWNLQNWSLSGGDWIKNSLDSTIGGGLLTSITTKAQTLLAGGRLVFPEIWQDSGFGRSYSMTMKLVSPTMDKLSVYLCELVPLYHILALILPRQSTQGEQGYISPFLLRMYYKGKFNIDMGIATSLSVIRGAEAEWSKDGLPTVLELQMTVKDLYSKFFMSETGLSMFSNITELDYIANTCGININTSEASRATMLWKTISGQNMIKDYVNNKESI